MRKKKSDESSKATLRAVKKEMAKPLIEKAHARILSRNTHVDADGIIL